MAYQTGTASSLSDLKTTLELFATTNGWALNSGVLSKAGCHVKFTSDVDYLRFNIGSGDDGNGGLTDAFDFTGVSTGDQYRNSGQGFQIVRVRNSQTMQFPITYHLISHVNPENIFLIINYNITHCQHIAFGNFQKYGTWGGGQYGSGTTGWYSTKQQTLREYSSIDGDGNNGAGAYLFANQYGSAYVDPCPSSAIKCDVDAQTWRGFSQTYNNDFPTAWERTCSAAAWSQPYLTILSTVNLQPVMCPPVLCIGRPAKMHSIAGIMPHVRYLRIDNYNVGDVISVGSQRWIVFPHTNKQHYNGGWAIKYDGP